jgi:hypothetical protein
MTMEDRYRVLHDKQSVFSVPLVSPQGEQLEPMYVVAGNIDDAYLQGAIAAVAINNGVPFNC